MINWSVQCWRNAYPSCPEKWSNFPVWLSLRCRCTMKSIQNTHIRTGFKANTKRKDVFIERNEPSENVQALMYQPLLVLFVRKMTTTSVSEIRTINQCCDDLAWAVIEYCHVPLNPGSLIWMGQDCTTKPKAEVLQTMLEPKPVRMFGLKLIGHPPKGFWEMCRGYQRSLPSNAIG